mmetsp:Transcript_58067/g.67793  ORF Transcript_58067/g.67793 Transcript_58067/m.67793 type:complete len:1143 (+) Transcript_58067:153-3581(+)
MTYKALALSVLLASSQTTDCDAFVVPSKQSPTLSSVYHRRINSRRTRIIRNLVEPSGNDGLTDILATSNKELPLTKPLRQLPTPIRKTLSLASIPAAAILGFTMTPSRRLIAHGVGATFAAVGGVIGKSRLDTEIADAALPALASLLLERGLSLKDAEREALTYEIEALKEEYNVRDDDFKEYKVQIYQSYLKNMCKNPFSKTSDLKELSNLKDVLQLDNIQIGEAHAQASEALYGETCAWTAEEDLEDEYHPDRMGIDKCLFLSERAFRNNDETDEAFQFEFARVARCFKLDVVEGIRRVEGVSTPFYERALKSTREKLGSGVVDGDMLRRARGTLGISKFVADDLHAGCYSSELQSLMGISGSDEGLSLHDEDLASIQLPEGALERLTTLKDILELSDEDTEYELSVEVTPLFLAAAEGALEAALDEEDETPAGELWEEILQRKRELGLTDATYLPLVKGCLLQTLGVPLESASGFQDASNGGKAYEALLKALEVQKVVFALVPPPTTDGDLDIQTLLDPAYGDETCHSFIASPTKKRLYSTFVSKSIQNSESGQEFTTAAQADAATIQQLLGLSDEDADDESSLICAPLIQKDLEAGMKRITQEWDFAEEMVGPLAESSLDLIGMLKVQEGVVNKYRDSLYFQFLKYVAANSPMGIPSTTDSTKLLNLRTYFNYTPTQINAFHLETFGPTYKKSILEAMGITGIMLPEYREALVNLRDRLTLTERDAQTLFEEVIASKVKPMTGRIVMEMERTMMTKKQLSDKRKKDMGEDVYAGKDQGNLGIGSEGNILGDIINLVDFYVENQVPRPIKSDGENDDEDELYYPITILGKELVEDEMANAMYRQLVVGSFTEQNQGKAKRYEDAIPHFGSIIGLDDENIAEVGGTIGTAVYENYVTSQMAKKPVLDQQDMMFIANIQKKLQLTDEKSLELLMEAQKKVLVKDVEFYFDNPDKGINNPAALKRFRERCNQSGLTMVDDVGLGKQRVAQLFLMEITEGIEKGTFRPASSTTGSTLMEIQESLGLTSEDAEAALVSMVKSRAQADIEDIQDEMMADNTGEVMVLMKDVLNFGAFVGGVGLELGLTESQANKLLGLFEASDFGDVSRDEVEEQVDLLKTCLGLNDNEEEEEYEDDHDEEEEEE